MSYTNAVLKTTNKSADVDSLIAFAKELVIQKEIVDQFFSNDIYLYETLSKKDIVSSKFVNDLVQKQSGFSLLESNIQQDLYTTQEQISNHIYSNDVLNLTEQAKYDILQNLVTDKADYVHEALEIVRIKSLLQDIDTKIDFESLEADLKKIGLSSDNGFIEVAKIVDSLVSSYGEVEYDLLEVGLNSEVISGKMVNNWLKPVIDSETTVAEDFIGSVFAQYLEDHGDTTTKYNVTDIDGTAKDLASKLLTFMASSLSYKIANKHADALDSFFCLGEVDNTLCGSNIDIKEALGKFLLEPLLANNGDVYKTTVEQMTSEFVEVNYMNTVFNNRLITEIVNNKHFIAKNENIFRDKISEAVNQEADKYFTVDVKSFDDQIKAVSEFSNSLVIKDLSTKLSKIDVIKESISSVDELNIVECVDHYLDTDAFSDSKTYALTENGLEMFIFKVAKDGSVSDVKFAGLYGIPEENNISESISVDNAVVIYNNNAEDIECCMEYCDLTYADNDVYYSGDYNLDISLDVANFSETQFATDFFYRHNIVCFVCRSVYMESSFKLVVF